MNQYSSKIVKKKLYWEITKGRRSSKGNRWLTHMWPNKKELKEMFVPKYAYMNHIGPGDIAGNHFHKNKKEIFCPVGKLDLLFEDPDTGKRKVIKMNIGNKNKYVMYYIPPHIPHAVRNSTKKWQSLIVLTNKVDLYNNTFKYQIT